MSRGFKRQQEARDRDAAAGLATRVLHLRLKDKHAPHFKLLAGEVNTVWNYCNDIGQQMLFRQRRFVNAGELDALTSGATKCGLNLHSQTVQAISAEFVTRRQQFKKIKLRWRVSNAKRADRSLGWIPFKKSAISYKAGQVRLAGVPMSLWDSYGLADCDLGSGSICEDARGRWYLNVSVKVKKKPQPDSATLKTEMLGIDLGLKDLMVDSEGGPVESRQFYRDLEPALAVSQRARKKNRTRAIHAKIGNRRKDFQHKLSTLQVSTYHAIAVGDVNPAQLAKTRMAKSVLDAGWSQYRTMLQYKSDSAGTWFAEINEKFSTQDCHLCGTRCGPKGLQGLSVRRWVCTGCGTEHDRDVNSARVIKARGLVRLEKEFAAADSRLNSSAAKVNEDSGGLPPWPRSDMTTL